MKALLISIHTEHALNILNGSKTLELRKSVPKGYVGWVYGYVTKGGVIIYNGEKIYQGHGDYSETSYTLNATIPFRFWFEEYEELFFIDSEDDYKLTYDFGIYYDYDEEIFTKLCLTKLQVNKYGQGKDLYAWHINKLEVFDKPMELGEFQNYMPKSNDIPEALITSSWQILHQPLTKAPQSWQYVYVKGEEDE